MKDRNFIDTNILIYLYSSNQAKQNVMIDLLKRTEIFVISTQIVNEFCNVLLKKLKYTKSTISTALEDFKRNFEIINIELNTIEKALLINESYKYSFLTVWLFLHLWNPTVLSSIRKICNIIKLLIIS
ncbi:MAG: PIN domain-containing protein [Candidatus Eremiobacterota bacterium]